jgi:D-3-phosphoglycerate dehydrogenase
MFEPAARKNEILVLNRISPAGLNQLPPERYAIVKASQSPDAILVRSHDLHGHPFGPNLKAVGRAGAGVNNIPVPELSARGVPVFNAPGANANAVKELVLAGMLLAARNLVPALEFVRGLAPGAADLERAVEDGKKRFAGFELPGHTLGVIGLGKVGSMVAEAAWGLPSLVRRAGTVEEVLKSSHFVTLHVPLLDATRKLIGAHNIGQLHPGAVLLNFSRDGVVDNGAVLGALGAGRLKSYVTDFPTSALIGHAGVVAMPHLGASTAEAEENSAVMVVNQLRDYLEDGNLRNAVNFPQAVMARESPYRLAIPHANVPDMLARISHVLGRAGINIHNMLNKSRADMAYTLVDADTDVKEQALEELRQIDGVLGVRYLPKQKKN